MNLEIILSMAGGLGLFLFGMRVMSESIEKVAGAKLRQILEQLTTNRFTGILVGVIFTAIIQSSSACTVMVVSFVNSGLMNLYQAAGVIFGANIGTTVTSLLVSFKLEKIAPVILLVGVIVVMFCKKQKITKFGEIIVGFGILFMGLSTMSGAMSGMKDSEAVLNMFASLTNPILAVLLGTFLTAVIQSSSVTVSIMVLMANQGLLGLDMCMFIILGCNIGACTSALLASLSGKKDAKRAALIHFLFNVLGTLLMMVLIPFLSDWMEAFFLGISGGNMGRAVANTHTIFKIFQVVVLFPFAGGIVKLTYLLVPGSEGDEEKDFELLYIGAKNVFSPATAVVEVTKELEHMGQLAYTNLNRAMNSLITLDEEDIAQVYQVEEYINFLNHAITDYLVKINQTTLPVEDAKNIGGLFHVVNDIERIGDHAENVADAARQRIEENVNFSKEAIHELGEIMEPVNKILQYALDTFSHNNREHVEEIVEIEDSIDHLEKQLQQSHVNRLTKNQCTPAAGMIFSDLISGLERVADHATNIAFAILEE